MTNEKIFFLNTLSDFINKRKTGSIPDDISCDILKKYAREHELEAVMYYQTNDEIFYKAFKTTVFLNTKRKRMVKELLNDIDFPYFIVKGQAVSSFYPVPVLRTMGDTDIVVGSQDKGKMHEIFLKHGYVEYENHVDHEKTYYIDNMEFELHDHLLYAERVNTQKQIEFFNDFMPYIKDNALDLNFHFLFLICHLRKHFMNVGVGIRQFMDIAIFTKYAELNWEWIEEKAEEIELLDFMRSVLAFCSRWFDIKVPIEIPSFDEDFYEVSAEKILKDGIFGFSNEENECSGIANRFRKKGTAIKILRFIFPSYEVMLECSDYSFIKGKKILLPLSWVYRALRKAKDIASFPERIKDVYTSSKQAAKREKMYTDWGL